MNIHIINCLLKLKNSASVNKCKICLKYNKKVVLLLRFLYAESLIQAFYLNGPTIEVYFKAENAFLDKLHFFSTSSKHLCMKLNKFILLSAINKTLVVSTAHGLFTDLKCKKFRCGGKVLFGY